MATTESVKGSIDRISHEFEWLRALLIDIKVDRFGNIDLKEIDKQISQVIKSIEESKDEIDDLNLELEEIKGTIQELDSSFREVDICD